MILVVGSIYQGREAYAYRTFGENIRIFRDLDSLVRDGLSDGLAEDTIVRMAIDTALLCQVVIACDSYGGLTPIDATERRFVEIYGRILQELAALADRVDRVVCGLGQVIKPAKNEGQ